VLELTKPLWLCGCAELAWNAKCSWVFELLGRGI
jgi:hypothetical protein